MTQLFSPKTSPLNAQRKWDSMLGTTQDRNLVWSSSSGSFTNAHDNKMWLRLAHRGLRLRGNDRQEQDSSCRLCGQTRESQHHLLTCDTINPFRTAVLRLLQATHMDMATFAYPGTWLTCVDAKGTKLTTVQTGLIKIHWNIIYQHMTKQKLDKKRFSNKDVARDYARVVAQRIQVPTNQT
eukprot:6212938-Pleurochrysis_carterae.AAC.9